jgi:hypothetical protein
LGDHPDAAWKHVVHQIPGQLRRNEIEADAPQEQCEHDGRSLFVRPRHLEHAPENAAPTDAADAVLPGEWEPKTAGPTAARVGKIFRVDGDRLSRQQAGKFRTRPLEQMSVSVAVAQRIDEYLTNAQLDHARSHAGVGAYAGDLGELELQFQVRMVVADHDERLAIGNQQPAHGRATRPIDVAFDRELHLARAVGRQALLVAGPLRNRKREPRRWWRRYWPCS